MWHTERSRWEALYTPPSGVSRFAAEDGSGDRERAGAEGREVVRPAAQRGHGSRSGADSALPKAERSSTRPQGRDRRRRWQAERAARVSARRREGYPPEGTRPRSGLGRVARSRSDAPRLIELSGTAVAIEGTVIDITVCAIVVAIISVVLIGNSTANVGVIGGGSPMRFGGRAAEPPRSAAPQATRDARAGGAVRPNRNGPRRRNDAARDALRPMHCSAGPGCRAAAHGR